MPNPKPAAVSSPPRRTVNRAQLCAELGRSRQWVDERITGDPDFPVLQRGAQGRPYVFDVAVVRAYLEAEEKAARVFAAVTPQARLAAVRAAMAEHDLADRMAKLVDAEEMRAVVAKGNALWKEMCGKAIGDLSRRFGFSAAAEQDFRVSMDALADTFEATIEAALSPGGMHPPEEHPDPH